MNHPRLNASDWALGTMILGCSTVVYCELGGFSNFLFSLDLNVTVPIANLPLVTTNKECEQEIIKEEIEVASEDRKRILPQR